MQRAVELVASGMVVGLGHGSTASFAMQCIAALLKAGELKDITGVPCSLHVEQEARQLGPGQFHSRLHLWSDFGACCGCNRVRTPHRYCKPWTVFGLATDVIVAHAKRVRHLMRAMQ